MTYTIDISPGVNIAAGLGRYARALTEAMLPYVQPQLFYNKIPGRSQPIPTLAHLPTTSIRLGYKPWRMAVLAGQVAHIPFNRLLPPTSVFHATEHLLMPLQGIPTVLTVHDLIYRRFPQHHKRLNYWYLNLAMPLFVRRANAIIAISQATKRDLIQHYGTPADKIHVIYEAAATHFQPASPTQIQQTKQRYKLPERYIIVVGTIEPRKNYSRLLQALAQLRRDYPDVALVVVGGLGWLYEDFLAQIEALAAKEWVLFPGFVPDEDLPALYSGATLMAIPSVYEGFGLPLLEAMACGVPVISSQTSSLPELGGDAALYIDPYEVASMVEVLNQTLADADLRAELRAKGLAQAQRFSWDQAARQTLALYTSLAQ
jgi:glycosyltransferase involved in cell wall biosynthesis